jgi:hypothetical protein
MIFNAGADAIALAGEVLLTVCMLQAVMRAAITAVAAIIAMLCIVLSLQEVVHLFWSCLIFVSARRSIARCCEVSI